MTKFRTAGLALAGLLAVTAATATSAEAQWRRHHWGWGPGIAAGLATGALVGAAVAARPYGYYYGEPGYAYADPYVYDTGPFYSAPVYGTYGYRGWGHSNFCMEGYRRVACSQGGGY